MSVPFVSISPMFFAMGEQFDAERFVQAHGEPWKVPDWESLGSKSRNYLHVSIPDFQLLSTCMKIDRAIDFLTSQREGLLKLVDLTETRILCIQLNHSFSGLSSGTAERFPVDLLTILAEVQVELGVYISLQHQSLVTEFLQSYYPVRH